MDIKADEVEGNQKLYLIAMIKNKLCLLKEVSINHTNHWISAGTVHGTRCQYYLT